MEDCDIMNSKKLSPNEQMSRNLNPLRTSFLDILEEKEKKNIKYPRKLGEEENKQIKELLE